jgi:hypothetical protein
VQDDRQRLEEKRQLRRQLDEELVCPQHATRRVASHTAPLHARRLHAALYRRCNGAYSYSAVDLWTAQERERREAKARLDDDLAQASARVAAEKQKARL